MPLTTFHPHKNIDKFGRFLIIGCGSIGKRHLRNLRQLGIKDLAAFDVRQDRLDEIQKEFDIPVFNDLESALCYDVRVALICTPTSLHIPPALAAARKGCHLFIEKPLSHSLESVDELIEEVMQHNLLTLVGCNFRFHPGLQYIKNLIENEKIGRVMYAGAKFGQYLPDWHPWEDYRHGYSAQRSLGGGVILDRVHEIDYLRWLFGEVKELYCSADHVSNLEIDTEDVAEIIMHFSGGMVASAHLDYISRRYMCELEVLGEAGSIYWSYQDSKVAVYLASDQTWHSVIWEKYDPNSMYLEEMQHFINVLAGLEESQQDVEQASRVLRIALAAKQSAITGSKVAL
ncbi:MAG: Gfo/Idh/MocA family oxidoreductase [Chloroflexota bacterium]